MGTKVVTITQPTPSGAYVEGLTDTVEQSTGAADAGKVVVTAPNGIIDPSLIPIELPIPATEVSYDNPLYPTVEDALNFLLYIPIQLTFSNDQNIQEVGTLVTEITLIWVINKAVISQSLDHSIGSLDPSVRSFQVLPPAPGLTTSETWTLTVNDGTKSDSAQTTLSFEPKVYWGVSPDTTLTSSGVLGLASESFATALGRSMSFNCTGGAYPYYAFPQSFGLPNSVVVGGLAFTAYTVTVQPVTNAQGFTQEYNVIRFNNLQNGSNIPVAWS